MNAETGAQKRFADGLRRETMIDRPPGSRYPAALHQHEGRRSDAVRKYFRLALFLWGPTTTRRRRDVCPAFTWEYGGSMGIGQRVSGGEAQHPSQANNR